MVLASYLAIVMARMANAEGSLAVVGGEVLAFRGLVIAVVLLTLALVVFHVLLAVVSKAWKEGQDERDRWIELKATRASYFLLAVGVFGAVLVSPVSATPFLPAHVALLSFLLAEMVGSAYQLYLYRVGD